MKGVKIKHPLPSSYRQTMDPKSFCPRNFASSANLARPASPSAIQKILT